MKKVIAVLVFVLFAQGAAVAAQRGTPEYEQMKAIKRKQAAEREQRKANPAAKPDGFWQREARRSGFAGTGAMFSNVVSGALPMLKSNSEKK